MRDYLISLKIFPRENRWRRIARIVPPPNVNPLFTPGERRSFGGEKSAECVPAVSPVCLGQNDVTAGGCSGVLASFEKMKMRPPDAAKSTKLVDRRLTASSRRRCDSKKNFKKNR